MMRVLLLGGTGAIGTYVTQHLREAGASVTVTSRSHRESHDGINYACGNAMDPPFLDSLFVDRWDAIIDFMVYLTDDFRTRIKGLLAATDQYIYLSSARVYADSLEPLTENSPRLLDVSTDLNYLRTDEYALAKARQEDILQNSGTTNWTIIRPYITYGVERLQLGVLEKEAWLYRALKGRKIVFSKEIAESRTTLTHGEDVARSICALICKKKALGEVFHITGTKPVLWSEVIEVYLETLTSTMEYTPNVVFEDTDTFINCHSGRHQIIYDRLYDRIFDSSKIARFVDTQTFKAPEAGLSECLKLFLKKPKFMQINWSLEGRRDRVSKQWVEFSEINSLRGWVSYAKNRIKPGP